MQSEDVATVAAAPGRRERPWPVTAARVVLFVTLPVLGVFSELVTGALETLLVMFPTPWHTAAVLAAVLLNIPLQLGHWRSANALPWRAAVTGYVAGMALLYALVEAPAVPMIVVFLFFLLGWLAAAPYFVLLGLVRVVEDLNACWRTSGRGIWQLAVTVAIFAVLPPLLAVCDFRSMKRDVVDLIQLSKAMQQAVHSPAEAQRVEDLAERVRGGDLEIQRRACAGVLPWLDAVDSMPRLGSHAWGGESRDFWFRKRFAPVIAAEAASVAFHRAHGRGWQEGFAGWQNEVSEWWPNEVSLEWVSSEITAHVDAEAAIAKVDWQIQITQQSRGLGEARMEFVLPPGSVASSLSLWVDGQERPAAFASGDVVQKAYSTVVAKRRDPALLQEIGPQRVRLLVFPVVKDQPPMRVRVGFTVPLRMRQNHSELWLPQVGDHNFGRRVVAGHRLHVGGVFAPWDLTFEAAGPHEAMAVPWQPCIAVGKDADGLVVQSVVAREPWPAPQSIVLVLDASASMAKTLPDASLLLQAFPAGTSCVTFVARGEDFGRFEGTTDGPELAQWLRSQPLRGGVDARLALAAALDESRARRGAPIYWLHGGAAELHYQPWPTPLPGERVFALAVSSAGNVLFEPRSALRDWLVEVPRYGSGPRQIVDSLAEFVRYGPAGEGQDAGEFRRVLVRATTPPAGSFPVSDQVARLWALREATAQRGRGDAASAQQLAARYRLVTAGTGAVVLETKDQYQANDLDPGAALGREPDLPIGSWPVPEPGSAILLAVGLLALLLWRRRSGDS